MDAMILPSLLSVMIMLMLTPVVMQIWMLTLLLPVIFILVLTFELLRCRPDRCFNVDDIVIIAQATDVASNVALLV